MSQDVVGCAVIMYLETKVVGPLHDALRDLTQNNIVVGYLKKERYSKKELVELIAHFGGKELRYWAQKLVRKKIPLVCNPLFGTYYRNYKQFKDCPMLFEEICKMQ